MTAAKPRTAAALVIGNELLSGKVQEANLLPLSLCLRRLGVELRRVVLVLDERETIRDEVRALAGSHDWLFTSGGVGPTHDDVTVESVAEAFGTRAVLHPELVKSLQEHYAERCTDGHLRMALVPEGAALEASGDSRWPAIRYRNTWLLPGVPEIFRLKLAAVERVIGVEGSFVTHAVYTLLDEGVLKPLLDDVVARYPDVAVGSYPKWSDPTCKTKLTFDGRDGARVVSARDAFVALLPKGEPQRLD